MNTNIPIMNITNRRGDMGSNAKNVNVLLRVNVSSPAATSDEYVSCKGF